VTPDRAAALAQSMRGKIRIVALIADRDDAAIETIIKIVRPDLLQLHGRESVKRTAEIRSHFSLPVIKALGVADAADLAAVPAYENIADMLLFDAKAPQGAERPGGHGAAFDWKLLAGRPFAKPWFVAGGLDPANVARAVEQSGAKMVDVSSGVESAPGMKDPDRIAAFMRAVRSPASLSTNP
jgi:phosphoribosylanthranilate isomerase